VQVIKLLTEMAVALSAQHTHLLELNVDLVAPVKLLDAHQTKYSPEMEGVSLASHVPECQMTVGPVNKIPVLVILLSMNRECVQHAQHSTLFKMIAQDVENHVFQSPVHQNRLLLQLAVSLAENAMLSPQTKEDAPNLSVKVIK
jgi:hypothetical protein